MIVYDIQGLTYRYPGQQEPANLDITLQIHGGEIFGILGDNGAGKTTLVRQMVNLLRPTLGSITLFGRDVGADPLHAPTSVGYMPQEAHALNNLTVGEALYFTAHLRGLSRREARKESDRLLGVWHMEDLRHKNSARLSEHQRRLLRLAVAMAGVGAMMAFVGRDRGESGNLLFVLTLLLTALGAVVIPPDRLPQAALVLGRLSPATYSASALRQTVVGPVMEQIILDLAVLFTMTVMFLWLVSRKMEWRQ